MPSSHTMNSLVLNGYAAYFLLKRDYVPSEAAPYLYAAVCAWTLWIGLARIYMGLHTPIDIAGGLAAGVVTLGAYISVDGVLRRGVFAASSAPTCAMHDISMRLSSAAALSGQASCAQIRSRLGSSTGPTWAESWCAAHISPHCPHRLLRR